MKYQPQHAQPKQPRRTGKYRPQHTATQRRRDNVIKAGAAIAGAALISSMGTADAQITQAPEGWEPRPGCSHQIRSGETMTQIAINYATTIDGLMESNPWIVNADDIAAGATIDACGVILTFDQRMDLLLNSQQEPAPVIADVAPDASNPKPYVFDRATRDYGWEGYELDALEKLLHNESNWQLHADNPSSTAFGLFQFMSFTAEAYNVDHPDWNGRTPSLTDQTEAGLRYISDRYGSPSRALSHWEAAVPINGVSYGHWY